MVLMRNIKLLLQYDGTDFSGWQAQARGERTVQTALIDGIARLTGQTPLLKAAGRTDAGVHALGQVACFQTASPLPPATIKRALNALLPPDVRVASAGEVDETFHPRYSAGGKRYFYLIANMDFVSPFARRYAWRLPFALDLPGMEDAARRFEGEHDFRALMGAGSGVRETVRTITSLAVERKEGLGFLGARLEGGFIKVTVEGTGFLRHMARNIVGTLVEVARGRLGPESVGDIIESGDRGAAGPTAPARGLFLESVFYP
jgi:tRNA pseudouridine38-40 synthase